MSVPMSCAAPLLRNTSITADSKICRKHRTLVGSTSTMMLYLCPPFPLSDSNLNRLVIGDAVVQKFFCSTVRLLSQRNMEQLPILGTWVVSLTKILRCFHVVLCIACECHPEIESRVGGRKQIGQSQFHPLCFPLWF